jgi:hypothetical protein
MSNVLDATSHTFGASMLDVLDATSQTLGASMLDVSCFTLSPSDIKANVKFSNKFM